MDSREDGGTASKFRYLAFAPGQTWSGWALFEEDALVDMGLTMTESFLKSEDKGYLAKLEMLNRRLLGLRHSVQDLVVRHAPLNWFVAWNPSTSATAEYAMRAGQYVGIMKSVCFEHKIPLIDVNDDEGRAFMNITPDAARDDLEEAVAAHLRQLTLPAHLGTYDSGKSFKATPIDAITVGWVAYERLSQYQHGQ